MKLCPECQQTLPTTEFYKSTRDVISTYCRDCTKVRLKRWRESHREEFVARRRAYEPRRREQARRQRAAKRGGDYEATFAAQAGRCAICGTTEPGGNGSWCVDHSHEWGGMRGLLCRCCNLGLGFFRDDPFVVAAALEYLVAHRDPAEIVYEFVDGQLSPKGA